MNRFCRYHLTARFIMESNKYQLHDPVRELFPMDSYPTFNKLELQDSDWTSLYVPAIMNGLILSNSVDRKNHKFQGKYLKSFIENNLCLGKVKRIDFVNRQIESSSIPIVSAYIHFEYWFDSDQAKQLRNVLNSNPQSRMSVSGFQTKERNWRFSIFSNGVYKSGFLNFKINHRPIEEAEYDVNIHQLKAATTILESKLKEKDVLIKMLLDFRSSVNTQLQDNVDNPNAQKWANLISTLEKTNRDIDDNLHTEEH